MKKLDEFETNSMIVFLLSIFAGILGYIYQIILGHYLSVDSYGKINTLFSVISIISSIVSPLCLIINRNVAAFNYREEYDTRDSFLSAIMLIVFGICAITVIGLLIFIKCEGDLFSNWEGIVFVVVVVTNIIYSVFTYVAQGYRRFFLFGFTGLLLVLVKLVVSVCLFIESDYSKIASVVLAMMFSNLFCIFLLAYPTKSYKAICLPSYADFKKWWKSILVFYQWSFFMQVMLVFVCNGGDIIIVNHFFSDEVAGLYSAASTLCKISMFGVTPIITIMFTEVSQYIDNTKKTMGLLFKTIMYCVGIATFYLIILNIFGTQIICMLYGVEYGVADIILLPMSVYIVAVILLNILCQYAVAVNKVKGVTVGLFVVFFIIGIIANRGYEVKQFIYLMALVLIIFSISLCIKMFMEGNANEV